jgi:tetratricopeptide (TPR) repeat protein
MITKARAILVCFLFLSALLISSSALTQTASPQQTLNQYVTEMQSNPNDTALRGKIISLALTMNPPPEVPAEARRHMARGVAAVEDAKTPGDFKDACNEFEQAATLAPWLANAYRNLAIAQDKTGLYDESLASLRLYLLTRPSPADADWAEDLKAKVEYRKEKAAKAKEEENSPQAVAAREQNSFEELLRKIDGRRYYPTTRDQLVSVGCAYFVVDIRGKYLVGGWLGRRYGGCNGEYSIYTEYWRTEIRGRVISHSETGQSHSGPVLDEETFTISEYGDTIAFHATLSGGVNSTRDGLYRWQR